MAERARREEIDSKNTKTVPRQTIRDASITTVMMPRSTVTMRFARALARGTLRTGTRMAHDARIGSRVAQGSVRERERETPCAFC
jgi:hypothetical protein